MLINFADKLAEIKIVADSQYNAEEENLRMLADLQDKLNEAGVGGVVHIVQPTERRDDADGIIFYFITSGI